MQMKSDQFPIDRLAVILFVAFAIIQFALLFVYKASYAGHFLPNVAIGNGFASVIPYISSREEIILPPVAGYIAIYYTLAVALIVLYIIICLIRTNKPVTTKNVLLLLIAVVFVSVPWLWGLHLTRTDMGNFHRGEVLDHFLYMNAILLVVGAGCAAAFGIRRSTL